MADEATTTVDTSGIGRQTDGTIQDGQTTQTDQAQSNQNTTQTTSETQTTTTDGKTLLTEGKKEEVKTESKKDEKSTAPEKYEDYKLPEGFTLDAEVKGKADALFKGLGLNQEQAQSLVDFYGEQLKAVATAPVDAYKAVTDGWAKESMDHPDLRGKLGPGQEVNVRIAKALDGLGDPKLASDFKQLMDLTGAGNNQAFIRVIDKFAQKVTEGTHVAGKGPSELGQSRTGDMAKPTAAAAMWPNLSNR